MDELVQLIVNNGLGIASFLCLIYFMRDYIVKINNTMEKVSETLISIENNLIDLSNRVEKIEKKSKKKEDEKE